MMSRDEAFPVTYWRAWDADAVFLPGEQLPPESKDSLWAVLVFVFYGDKIALADIQGRGMCIPSGKIEPDETIDQAAERECWEEIGARLSADQRRLIGCYRLVARGGERAGQVRFCPVFIAEALGFEALPQNSESNGLFLAAAEDVADLYFTWDPLIASVFEFAQEERRRLLPAGVSLSTFMS